MIKIKRGLDLPIEGAPAPGIEAGPAIRSVALVGFDYVGMKPTMLVKEGDKVSKGQVVFEDKKTPGVKFTAPASGTVRAINRGAKRVFESLVIDVEGDDEVTFAAHEAGELLKLHHQQVVDQLVESGLWTALRTRPFSKVPSPEGLPSAVFVNLMDSNPLAFDPMLVVNEQRDSFVAGLDVLSHLAESVFVCHEGGVVPPKGNAKNLHYAAFSGPHPAGLAGTHVHFLNPVSEKRSVWTINYQDVIAVGKLFTTGKLCMDRVVSLAGPAVKKPRLLRTVIGASLDELTAGELRDGDNRVISGSVLAGRKAEGTVAWLGRYHLQVSVLAEGRDREFMAWFSPGSQRFSAMRIYLSQFAKHRKFPFTTNTNGSPRAMVPIGAYEQVMPLDILPTQLLRALIVGDTDTAVKLGALELDEEDLALCTFVCPGKYEYGAILRDNLTRIEKEG
ncbi:MAG TPA: Na(+)-translocating NADH-quinone reductase subunit A [Pseudomonadales bacterium]